ncbi:hypothetical protein [Paenibacillus sp. L3-i20]|uniref:hypothetical protein n=1 Tax=Paenibacillus sp. L3-i20 TaxID=2905833 RepID=UPI001EDF81DE|nr:hypothetical protein [Paenibacillus sp. L3-i20]GKU76563.1 hypothetical protein L3i20_v209600 [Paenibacillus sp. L3-i20]
MRLITCILIVLLSLTGCRADSESKNETTKITLTPVELFKGKEEKYKPFLGSMTGAFKLRYDGNRPSPSLDIDILEYGKKIDSAGSIGDVFFSTGDKENKEVEIMISIDKVSIKDQVDYNKIKVSTINPSGVTHSTFTMPAWEKEMVAQGVISNHKSVTFGTDQSVHVWGIHETSANQIHTEDLSSESVSRMERAIMFTLRFED